MRKRNLPNKRNSQVRRQRDPIPWKYCFLTLVCGMFLVAGFFWAARQHFATIDYGMKNAKLRKQIEDLASEKRRLQLNREIALSPGEIKKAAKKLGLTAISARNIEVIGTRRPTEKSVEQISYKDASPAEARPVGLKKGAEKVIAIKESEKSDKNLLKDERKSARRTDAEKFETDSDERGKNGAFKDQVTGK